MTQGLLHAANAAKCEVLPSVLKHLSEEDSTLNSTVKEFTSLCKDELRELKAVCFFETKLTTVGRIIGKNNLRVSRNCLERNIV